jgi:hypothetical protein
VGPIFLFVNKYIHVMGQLFLQTKDIPQTRFNLVCGINIFWGINVSAWVNGP